MKDRKNRHDRGSNTAGFAKEVTAGVIELCSCTAALYAMTIHMIVTVRVVLRTGYPLWWSQLLAMALRVPLISISMSVVVTSDGSSSTAVSATTAASQTSGGGAGSAAPARVTVIQSVFLLQCTLSSFVLFSCFL